MPCSNAAKQRPSAVGRSLVQMITATGSATVSTAALNLFVRQPITVWLDDLKLEEVLSDGATAEVQRPDVPVDHRFMRRWIELYHGPGQPYLALGRMLHPPQLQTAPARQLGPMSFPPVLHNAFEASDGSQAVVLVNWTAEPQRCDLTWQRRSQSIELQPGEIRLVR